MGLLAGIGSIIGGIGGLLGGASSVGSVAMASANPKESYKYNLKLQKQAQGWQEKMSNTAHQRELSDLEAAGLNPILTASGGQGASTGSVGANSAQGFGSVDSSGFGLLQQTAQNMANVDNLRANTENIRQDSILKGAQVLTERQRINNYIQDLEESKSRQHLNQSQIRRIDSEISLMRKQMQGIDSTIALNSVNQNQALVNTNLLNSTIDKVKAETKYTNERSRGFSESYTDSYNGHIGGPLGAGSGGSHSYSRSY